MYVMNLLLLYSKLVVVVGVCGQIPKNEFKMTMSANLL